MKASRRLGDLLHVLRNAEAAPRHLGEEAFEPARREDDQVPALGFAHHLEGVLLAARDENGVARLAYETLTLQEELACAGEDHEGLVLPVMHMPRRAGARR